MIFCRRNFFIRFPTMFRGEFCAIMQIFVCIMLSTVIVIASEEAELARCWYPYRGGERKIKLQPTRLACHTAQEGIHNHAANLLRTYIKHI